ncbi:MAG: DUF3619 family protein [Burkholderiaceae bacterium]
MNEQLFALSVRRALDESAERLPYRVSHRLAGARQAALARLPASAEQPLAAAALAAAPHGGTSTPLDGLTPPLRWRLLATLVPLIVLGLGLYGISHLEASYTADAVADVDEAVLVDDIPIAAYADRGFGVFLKNMDQRGAP